MLGVMRFRPWRWISALSMLVAIAAAVAAVPNTAGAAEAIVTDVRVGPHAKATRVVFEISRLVPYRIFMLGNPSRVVIDLPEVGWRLPPRPLPQRVGVFETLRYGLYKPGNSRVVVDLKSPAVIGKAFLMGPSGTHGHRIVVDLNPATKRQFAKFLKKGPIEVKPEQPGAIAKPIVAPTKAPVVAAATRSVPGSTKRSVATARQPSPPKTVKVSSGTREQAAASSFRLAPRKPALRPEKAKRVVVIDPGHGGPDPGTIGLSGSYEKHITLAMARTLRDKLEATGRYKVVLTRDRDIFIRLRDRIQIARDSGGELFISLHADSIKNRRIRGPSVYTLSEKASDKEAAALAEKENKADVIAGVDLTHESPEIANILIDLAQRESTNQSVRFATTLLPQLKKQTKLLRNSHRFAGFAVLKAPDIPSVLVEMGFLSNREDERALRSQAYRNKLAIAVTRAVDGYFSQVEEASRR